MSCTFSSEGSPCGAARFAPDDTSILPLKSCNADISSHLHSLHLQSSSLSEWELIANRKGMFNHDPEEVKLMTVCPKHRYNLGTNWSGARSVSCKYPAHKGKHTSKGHGTPRRVNRVMSEQIFDIYNTAVPIGSGKIFCYYLNIILIVMWQLKSKFYSLFHFAHYLFSHQKIYTLSKCDFPAIRNYRNTPLLYCSNMHNLSAKSLQNLENIPSKQGICKQSCECLFFTLYPIIFKNIFCKIAKNTNAYFRLMNVLFKRISRLYEIGIMQ